MIPAQKYGAEVSISRFSGRWMALREAMEVYSANMPSQPKPWIMGEPLVQLRLCTVSVSTSAVIREVVGWTYLDSRHNQLSPAQSVSLSRTISPIGASKVEELTADPLNVQEPNAISLLETSDLLTEFLDIPHPFVPHYDGLGGGDRAVEEHKVGVA